MAAATLNMEQARFNMIQQQIRPWEVLDPAVLDLLAVVKREDFVPAEYRELAFADVEIPIGCGQAMLPPRIEARMLQELSLRNTDKVLEIGAGSGFMTALLAARAEFVYAVEIEPALVDMARGNLRRAGVANVSVDLGDAHAGWSLYPPYDAIMVSGALPWLPESLLKQLRVGGRLVAVVGVAPAMKLQLVTRTEEDAWVTVDVLETEVAPLTHSLRRNAFVF